jgi:hypothetical protein
VQIIFADEQKTEIGLIEKGAVTFAKYNAK